MRGNLQRHKKDKHGITTSATPPHANTEGTLVEQSTVEAAYILNSLSTKENEKSGEEIVNSVAMVSNNLVPHQENNIIDIGDANINKKKDQLQDMQPVTLDQTVRHVDPSTLQSIVTQPGMGSHVVVSHNGQHEHTQTRDGIHVVTVHGEHIPVVEGGRGGSGHRGVIDMEHGEVWYTLKDQQ